jgi:hypothetical protein
MRHRCPGHGVARCRLARCECTSLSSACRRHSCGADVCASNGIFGRVSALRRDLIQVLVAQAETALCRYSERGCRNNFSSREGLPGHKIVVLLLFRIRRGRFRVLARGHFRPCRARSIARRSFVVGRRAAVHFGRQHTAKCGCLRQAPFARRHSIWMLTARHHRC